MRTASGFFIWYDKQWMFWVPEDASLADARGQDWAAGRRYAISNEILRKTLLEGLEDGELELWMHAVYGGPLCITERVTVEAPFCTGDGGTEVVGSPCVVKRFDREKQREVQATFG